MPTGRSTDKALLLESTNSNYYNVLATRPELEANPGIVKLYSLVTDPRIKEYIHFTWRGLIIPVAQFSVAVTSAPRLRKQVGRPAASRHPRAM